MQNKMALRMTQIGLLLLVVAVVIFGRKSPHAHQLVPHAIPGDQPTSDVLQLRRAVHPPVVRPLLPITPPRQGGAPHGPNDIVPVASSRATALPAERQVRRHRIVEGDTIQRLAQQYLGDAARAAEIYQANSRLLTSPDVLPLGEYLIIPPIAAHHVQRQTVRELRPTVPTLDSPSRPMVPVP